MKRIQKHTNYQFNNIIYSAFRQTLALILISYKAPTDTYNLIIMITYKARSETYKLHVNNLYKAH